MLEPVRVLVVDDSAFMRHAITQILTDDPQIKVVGAARDGLQALEMIDQLRPDVVTMDVEMPRLDGLATLERLMGRHPLPVIMVSSSTHEGASTTMSALALGAVDFVAKPSGPISLNIRQVGEELVAKVKAARAARIARRRPLPRDSRPAPPAGAARRGQKVVIVGSSTGGPRALYEVIPALPGDLDAALLIVQHMPVGFTRSLAEKLNEMSELTIREAETGDRLETGLGLLAPGGRHLVVGAQGTVTLSDAPPMHGVRPAIDVAIESAARIYGASCLAVILTGMGSDGTLGCQLVKAAGGKVIAEDESTCVVYGMPKSVVEAGAADRVVPLPDIPAEIVRALLELDRAPACRRQAG